MSYEKTFDEGVALLEGGDAAAAARIFKECTRQRPGDYDAWLYLGIAFTELQVYQDAIAAFKECIKIDGNRPHAYTNLGIVYQKKNDIAEAVRHFYKATRIDPTDINARLNLGMAYYKTRNKVMEAMFEFKYVLEHDDTIPDAWSSLGLIFLDLQKKPYAMYCFQKAEALGHKSERVHRLILEFKFDGIVPKNPLDPAVKDEAFTPVKKDVLTQQKD
ncbi:MAG: tetratricopeptide repeat protein [Candidatus Sigynarchaeum springense]